MKRIVAVAIGVLLSLFALRARAADDCLIDAQESLNKPPFAGSVSSATLIGRKTGPVSLKIERPCTGSQCSVAIFAEDKNATISGVKWTPNVIPKRAGSACASLFGGTTKTIADNTPPTPNVAPTAAEQAAAAATARSEALDALNKTPLKAFKDQRKNGIRVAAIGHPQGLEDVTAETLQILGQIVVDRASAEAYRIIKDKLEALLGCEPDDTSTPSPSPAPAPTTKALPKPTFPATCKVLQPLRLQDIATSRDALLGALVQDGTSYLYAIQATLDPTQKKIEEVGAVAVVASVVVPLIVRPSLLADNMQARTIVGAIESYVANLSGDDLDKLNDERKRALAAGVIAYTRCVVETADTGGTGLANCSFTAYADQYAGDNQATKVAARAIAGQLIAIATLTTGANAQPDTKQRTIKAVDALFAGSCMLLGDPTNVTFACPAPPTTIDTAHLTALQILELLQPIVDSALEGDTNSLISSIAAVIQLFAADEYAKTNKKAFLLLGSLVEYSATYAAQTSGDAAQQHDQRTKILESLTKDMTDRTARDGDNIWSFGGSLRAVGGVRIGGAMPAVLSPVSLPIGVGFDHVAVSRGAPAIHFDISPIDLGQYVAYDNKGTVKTPDPTDAFAPTATIALAWGRSIPLILGITTSYSPSFKLDDSKDTHGTFNIGATVGMYVPLIDLN